LRPLLELKKVARMTKPNLAELLADLVPVEGMLKSSTAALGESITNKAGRDWGARSALLQGQNTRAHS